MFRRSRKHINTLLYVVITQLFTNCCKGDYIFPTRKKHYEISRK